MTATLAVRPATANRRQQPAVRVRPAPPLEPPTDDQLRVADWEAPPVLTPALPLEWPDGTGRGHGGRQYQDTGSGSGARHAPGGAEDRPRGGDFPHGDARPGPADEALLDRSPARLATRRFLAVCLEVMGGFRPVTHLQALCSADEFVPIAQHLTGRTAMTPAGRKSAPAHLTARTPVLGRPGTGAPPRSGRNRQTGPPSPVVVRRVQLCEPREGIAEVAVVLGWRDKVWAAALRLEEIDGRWLCTYLRTL